MTSAKETASSSVRLRFIDGLRGTAAGSVLLFHIANSDFYLNSSGGGRGIVALVNKLAAAFGFLGVEIFFVISGFVIAYSLRSAKIDGAFTAKFVVRRSLRLDLPYWAAIVLATCTAILFTRLLHATTYPIPSARTIATNMLYLQHILHRPDIVMVFWTLCYEVQFYTTYMLLQFVAQRAGRGEKGANAILTAILLITGVASLACFMKNPAVGGWCYNWWYLFAFGALICRQMLANRKSLTPLYAVLLIAAALCSARREPIAGALTGVGIFAAIYFNGLCTWLSGAVIQYLGRISYSLYLTHALVIQVLSSILTHVHSAGIFHTVPVYLLMVGVSIGCAEGFYRIFERPSHQLAIRFGRTPARIAKPPVFTHPPVAEPIAS